MSAYVERLVILAAEGDGDGCESLITRRGVDVNEKNEDGTSALCVACHKGHEDVARLLLNSGARCSC